MINKNDQDAAQSGPKKHGSPIRSQPLAHQPGKVRRGCWWALLHHPGDLPVIFQTLAQARESKLTGEYLVKVTVDAVNPKERSV